MLYSSTFFIQGNRDKFAYKIFFLKTILNSQQLRLITLRLAHQLLENNDDLNNLVFIGLQPRGVHVSQRIAEHIQQLTQQNNLQYGVLDITFYRDDVRKELHVANKTEIPFSIEGKKVILIDDVLFTGRTIRAALDALQDFGRPNKVELAVLVDRSFNRELPIQPDYFGITIDTNVSQKVTVDWEKEEVLLS